MRRSIDTLLVCGLFVLPAFPAAAQSPPNPAMTAPDQVAWQLFIQANTRAGGSNSTFETWASDTDLFQPNPQFPAAATPPALRPPILPQVAREGVQQSGGLLPALPPGVAQGQMEETRHNKPTFDFIVQNNLYKLSGVKAAFGKTLSFPVDSIEVKANWVPVSDIPQFTNNKVTVAQVPQLYHVNSAAGVQYALVSMHVISKQVPNWTWATFEHRFNPSRCDIIGCRDGFGAHAPQVISVSWGSAEKFWTEPGRDAMQAVLADAARLRVSVLFASGDQLATSGLTDGKVHVWFPASSPYATSCGGTQPGPVAGNGSAAADAVWNAGTIGTGGGISDAFPVPDYQSHLTLPKSQNDGAIRRGVPDVACAAAASPGYRIIVNGQPMVMSGTSAATPLWAALVAIAIAARGEQIGFLNAALYANPGAFRVVEQGNNRVGGKGYDAGPGWSACTGLGVPKGADLLAALTTVPVA